MHRDNHGLKMSLFENPIDSKSNSENGSALSSSIKDQMLEKLRFELQKEKQRNVILEDKLTREESTSRVLIGKLDRIEKHISAERRNNETHKLDNLPLRGR